MTNKFDNIPGGQILSRSEAAEFMGVSVYYMDRIAKKRPLLLDLPSPRYLLEDLRKLKREMEEHNLLPRTLGPVDIADPNVPDGTFVSISDIARFFHVKRNTIHRWTKSGVLPDVPRLEGFPPRWRIEDIRKGVRKEAENGKN